MALKASKHHRGVVYVCEDIHNAFHGSVDILVKRILEVQAKYPGVELTVEHSSGDSWDSAHTNLVGHRPETDEEYSARVEQLNEVARKRANAAADVKAKAKKAEMVLYRQLHEKYGKDT